ncbi:glycosyltransferase family 2 protein [Vibrio lentus]|uniref:Acyltransferase n=1 Tax=Vibrio lentus TaxID=136468 RepID=A0AA44VPT7_9VIBR|nr:glycosyltransferase family 2 protein [Vibrio lentus]MCB5357670.1 glycosyltransferase family 2 protein [Vibrio lentus]MCB5448138.1 glycosyltransferase family 2 protein [Vibrio lentus]MCB5459999.1 glycosyltransferase family 2 protein [Vibrio lentus]MCC4794378.1 glycosyltransferase family 2 protein [Vibrio lentus]MCC4853629.1 glycosyltransferase family 2 protein [Vibrio lentus]
MNSAPIEAVSQQNPKESSYKACFLIPCFNHGATMPAVVSSLHHFELPIIIVDDGSELTTKQFLAPLAENSYVTLVTLEQNQGKGGAVKAGIKKAQQLGFSHAIQIDADGQHDLDALPALIQASQAKPQRLISGQPVYDESVPKARLYGRYATHIWVWIETLSLSIKDSMCGFRAYPIDKTQTVLNKYDVGSRMDFDIEILVRLYWEGCDIDFVETRVIYPENGVSHFDALWDNMKISWMHTRLFFGMLPRAPKLIARHFKTDSVKSGQNQDSLAESNKNESEQPHWSRTQERGTVLGIKLLLAVYTLLGRGVFNLILRGVMRYYHLTGKRARNASEQYLFQLKAYAEQQNIELPAELTSYNHLLSFGHTMLDKLAAWKGDFSVDNLTIHGQDQFESMVENQQGVLILGSHLGNIELCRALGRRHSNIKINALVFTEHAERFNSVMKAVNPQSDLNLIQVTSMGPDTAILLQQKLEQGEWIVIVGDRTSTSKESRSVWAEFLGKEAPFPQGPFMLASVLKAPVFLLFGLRDDSQPKPHFNVYFEHFSDKIELPRKTREQSLQQVVQKYANRLEHYTLKAPLQWYNFFNFWTLSKHHDEKESK